ncbi:hypothetical protein J4Q44_G00076010 [Coregonus suidteri]|uniref:Uncharacterized protein n=1 Tax=Coregonus suidteri TaxID=861788 RepID=A0AAN8M5R8_9TELE
MRTLLLPESGCCRCHDNLALVFNVCPQKKIRRRAIWVSCHSISYRISHPRTGLRRTGGGDSERNFRMD